MSTTKKKKSNIQNIIMVVAIVVILFAGLIIVGNLQGWFSTGSDESGIVAQNKVGEVNITRSGVAYSLKNGNNLREGDIVETLNGSTIDIVVGENTISLNENTQITLSTIKDKNTQFSVDSGNIFADIDNTVSLKIRDKDIATQKCKFSVNAPYGSASIFIYSDELKLDNENFKSGKTISIIDKEVLQNDLSIGSLNKFELTKVSDNIESENICFSKADITSLIAKREEDNFDPSKAEFLKDKNGNTPSDDVEYCMITVKCTSILDNMKQLKEGKDKYVPQDGCIIKICKVELKDGETAFNILKKACEYTDTQLEYSWTPIYNSYYIEGINNLYEFDCGGESGWMYKVNGWFPNYGCSEYKLKNGDSIEFTYTCNGLGLDVGGSVG